MRKWLPLVAVSLGTFMLLIDVTIVNVALPDMAVDFSAPFSSLQWVVDGYAVVLAALLLGAGGVADVVGRRRAYLVGLVVFAGASLACGLAPSVAWLILARCVQGAGAAAMFATTIALLTVSYSGRERGIALGIWGAVSGAAAAIGPSVGGVLTEALSWRWIFFVNLPISVVAIVLTRVAFAQSPAAAAGSRRSFDVAGLVAFTAAASLLTSGFVKAGGSGWTSAPALVLLIAGAASLSALALIERRVAAPLLDMGLLGRPRFVAVLVAAFALSVGAFSALAYSSIWLQSVLALSPLQAGAVFLPLSVAAFAVSALIGRVLHRADPRWVVGGGLLLIGAGSVAQSSLHGQSGWSHLLIGLFVVGVGVGLVNPTMTSVIMSAVPIQRSGMAAGALNTARQLGLALGIAVLGGVLQSRIAASLDGALPHGRGLAAAVAGGRTAEVVGTAAPSRRPALESAVRAAFASGLDAVFLVAGGSALVAGVVVLWLLGRPAGQAAGDGSAAGADVAKADLLAG